MFALLYLSPTALAFCGTFVGNEGSTLQNRASSVIISHQGNLNTLTLAADYHGDAQDFALVIPVPEVLSPEDVRVVDAALVNKVQTYATPRMVRYSCDDVVYSSIEGVPGCGMAFGCKDGSIAEGLELDGAPLEDSVTIEASFSVAAYDIVILSAEESVGLTNWLQNNGYQIPDQGAPILQEYIDSGSYFLAAKVHLDATSSETVWLPPLQFTYESEVFGLPIRIGTISSTGEQEVSIIAITDSNDGDVGIANYPEVTVEDECMPKADTLTDAYTPLLSAALNGEAGWIKEHSWDLGQVCDPCTAADPFTPEELESLGFVGATVDHYGSYLGHLTELRLRYTPEQATQDVILYTTGETYVATQTRYINYSPEMESFFPVCGEGFVDPPSATCWQGEPACVTAPTTSLKGPLSVLSGLCVVLILRRSRRA